MFFNNKFNIFFGLNLTLVYTFPMCMTWRFHFPLRNYDFKYFVCVYPGCKTLLPKIVACEGPLIMMTGSLKKKDLKKKIKRFFFF